MILGSRPVALVTGAAARVGRATALALARRGCDIAFTYRNSKPEADELSRELRSLGVDALAFPLALDDLPALRAEIQRIIGGSPRWDILVHNASVYAPSPLGDLTPTRVLADYAVNAAAPLLISAALAPHLRESPLPGGGAIVAMCDMHVLGRPRKDFASYAMSKAALVEMVRSLARDLAPRVRVNGVAPGVVAFPESGYESDQATQEAYIARVPLARAGTPDDAAAMVAWLALDATYVTGEVIRLDGGRWLA